MKENSKQLLLVIPFVGGIILALFLYTQVVNFFAKLLHVLNFNWFSALTILIIGALLTALSIGIAVKDFTSSLNSKKRIGFTRILKFLICGFVSCYALFLVMGGFALTLLILLKHSSL